eukprot:TCALIF_09895-PA protein Name:"Similar to noc3l Nucleolar complex protein 3 homolog (Danio rerio)" AED:0.27 eAED:0.27 QI:0/0/0/0.5/1/1/2/0/650
MLTKRNLQKRNKLIKKGKLKPSQKSSTAWHKNQQAGHNLKKLRKGEKGRHPQDLEQDQDEPITNGHASDSEDEMDLDQALLLGNQANLAAMEAKAKARYQQSSKNHMEVKPLLPIKTNKGLVQQNRIVEEAEDGSEGEEDEAVENGEEEDDEDQGPQTTLSLMANREMQLSELRLMLGNMATAFLQDPHQRIHLLDQLVATLSSQNAVLKNVGWMLAVSTIVEVFNDIIPAYRIADPEDKNTEVTLKKETLKLQRFEKTLLESAKTFLVKIQNRAKAAKLRPEKANLHTVRCLGELCTRHPQFNYSPNIVQLLIPLMGSKHAETRAIVRDTISTLLREDKRGEISLHVVKCIKKEVVRLKYHCRPDFIECMLDLKLSEVVPKEEDDAPRSKKSKKEKQTISKKEKKRQKAMSKLEKELLEAKGSECKATRLKHLTEVTKIIFHVLFTIIKDDDSLLLGPALKVISRFSHTISIDFLYDIVNNIARLVQNETIERGFRLQAIKTSLDLLNSNNGVVNYDTNVFLKPLSQLLPFMDLNQNDIDHALSGITYSMAVKRRKQVSSSMVVFLGKCVSSQLLHNEGLKEVMSTITSLKTAHSILSNDMLEAEGVIVPKGPEMSSNILALGSTHWEYSLLKSHYDPEVADGVQEWLK